MKDYLKDAIAMDEVKIIMESGCFIKEKGLEDLSLEEVKKDVEFVLKIVELNIEDEETIEWSMRVKKGCIQWLTEYVHKKDVI